MGGGFLFDRKSNLKALLSARILERGEAFSQSPGAGEKIYYFNGRHWLAYALFWLQVTRFLVEVVDGRQKTIANDGLSPDFWY